MDIFNYCKTGNLEVVRQLLMNGINPNIKDNYDNTSLYYASKHGHLNIVQELLNHNALVNERNNYSIITLHVSSIAEIASLLIQHSADIDVREHDENEYNTPLHTASLMGMRQVVDLLIWSRN
jgi:uncharacterized protein